MQLYMHVCSPKHSIYPILRSQRYIIWPGQATAYKIGEREIRKQREKAEQILGEEFDLKKFHEHLLSCHGTMMSSLGSCIEIMREIDIAKEELQF
jgi:uncharacterized protein (DUF885 family)